MSGLLESGESYQYSPLSLFEEEAGWKESPETELLYRVKLGQIGKSKNVFPPRRKNEITHLTRFPDNSNYV